jgi:phosphoglycolate phosphatase-like HAD superfamily hydrolase
MDAIDAVAFDLSGTLLAVASLGRAAARITARPAAPVDVLAGGAEAVS